MPTSPLIQHWRKCLELFPDCRFQLSISPHANSRSHHHAIRIPKSGPAPKAEVIRLRQRNQVLSAIVRLLFMLLRLAGVRLDETRIPDGAAKEKILTANDRARTTL